MYTTYLLNNKNSIIISTCFLIVFFISAFKVHKVNKKKAFGLFVVFCIGLLAFQLIIVKYKYFLTIFEYIAVVASWYALFRTVFISKIFYNKKPAQLMLSFVFCEALIVCFYSIFTFGQANIHSDTASGFLFTKSIIKNRTIFPSSWSYANGDIWVINHWPTCILPLLLLDNVPLIRCLSSSFSVLFAIISIAFISRKVYKTNFWYIAVPLIFIYLIGEKFSSVEGIVPISSDILLYQSAYTHLVTISVICIVLLYKSVFDNCNTINKYLILLCVCSIVLCMGGIRYIAEFSIPMIASSIIVLYFSNRNLINKSNMIKIFSITICSFIGILLYVVLCRVLQVNSTASNATLFVSSIDDFINNVKYYFINLYGSFGYFPNVHVFSIKGIMNLIFFFSCTILCFVVPILQLSKLNKEKEKVQLLFWYTIIHNIIIFFSIVLFGKMFSHYCITSIVLLIFVSSRYIYAYWITNSNKNYFIFIYSVCTIFAIVSMARISKNWYFSYITKREIANEILSYDCKKLYGEHWFTFTNEIYSDDKIIAGSLYFNSDHSNIGNDVLTLQPSYWLVDNSVYEYVEGIKSGFIFNDSEYNWVKRTIDIDSVFGKYEYHKIDDKHLLVFDHDISISLYNGLSDGKIRPSENMFVTEGLGYSEWNQLVIGPDGCTFGPYISMKKGVYKISINGYNLNNGKFYVSSLTSDDIILNAKNIDNELCEYELVLNEDADNVEFQFYNSSSDKDIYVYYFDIQENG